MLYRGHTLLADAIMPDSLVEPAVAQHTLAQTRAVLRQAFAEHPGRVAAVASFGAESAVLLALLAEIDPAVPVLFLETGKHFPETLTYRARLVRHLGLLDVRDIAPDPAALAAADPEGALWYFDPDACCALRKVAPLAAALAPFSAWISGRKRHQSATRADLPLVEPPDLVQGGRIKFNPLAFWTAAMVEAERERRGLPAHPLATRGYPSIGCAPCTRPVADGEDQRAGRWADRPKSECGIHGAVV
jgi:phosphoadenosine phosphosulfate reductase